MEIVSIFPQMAAQGRLPLSFEVFPPKGELCLDQARDIMAELAPLDPAFVSVTCSAAGSGNSGNTVAVAAMAKGEFALEPLAHLTCMGASRSLIDEKLVAMKQAGIQNVLALRGDPIPDCGPSAFNLARDLIGVVAQAGFCVGAAAYPEGHLTCFDKQDNLDHLRQKQEAGAQFFVTQLFFDNDCGLRFLDAARAAGITVPITFGIMPFLSKDQITRMVFNCGASLPAAVVKLLARFEHDQASLQQAGIEYACNQLRGLAEAGVDGLHVYTMNRPAIARAAAGALADFR